MKINNLSAQRNMNMNGSLSRLSVALLATLLSSATLAANLQALDVASLKPWFERFGDQQPQLINMYGITETTVHVTYRPLQAADAQWVGSSPIGRRIPDLQLYVLDARREPLPTGVVGELYVGGAGVARGYLNRDQLNAERFIADPFSNRPGARLYKTGDLARWRTDGSLEYLGRNDDQVKIRGFRIELGEVQARLAACDGVGEAVVIAREQSPGDKRLVAYVIPRPGAAPGAAQLREQLRQSLADYMLPSAFVQLDAFPLTPNGKLDRQSLPEPQVEAGEYQAPRTEQEQLLAGLWSELLGIGQISRDAQFFALGGDSIQSLSLVTRLRKAGWELTPKAVFQHPRLAVR